MQAIGGEIRETEVRIQNSSVYAVFDGIVTQKNAEVGEVVSAMTAMAGTGANARGAVATLVDFDSLEVQIELVQTSLRGVELGAPVAIFLDAYPGEPYRGRVRQIWPTADRQKATVELRAEFLERDGRVLPQMGARVVFVTGDAATARPAEVRVPRPAVVGGAQPSVFLYQPSAETPARGTASRCAIALAADDPPGSGTLRVTDGLQGNEHVILDPPPGLGDGDAVRVKGELQ